MRMRNVQKGWRRRRGMARMALPAWAKSSTVNATRFHMTKMMRRRMTWMMMMTGEWDGWWMDSWEQCFSFSFLVCYFVYKWYAGWSNLNYVITNVMLEKATWTTFRGGSRIFIGGGGRKGYVPACTLWAQNRTHFRQGSRALKRALEALGVF